MSGAFGQTRRKGGGNRGTEGRGGGKGRGLLWKRGQWRGRGGSTCGTRIVVYWRIFWAMLVVDDKIVFTPPHPPPRCRTEPSDQGGRVARYKTYTIHRWSHVMYERTHSSSIVRAKYLLFLGAFDEKLWDFYLWAGGAERDIDRPRDIFFFSSRRHHHRRSLAMNSWWYELEVELAGSSIYMYRESR